MLSVICKWWEEVNVYDIWANKKQPDQTECVSQFEFSFNWIFNFAFVAFVFIVYLSLKHEQKEYIDKQKRIENLSLNMIIFFW